MLKPYMVYLVVYRTSDGLIITHGDCIRVIDIKK